MRCRCCDSNKARLDAKSGHYYCAKCSNEWKRSAIQMEMTDDDFEASYLYLTEDEEADTLELYIRRSQRLRKEESYD